MIFLNIGKIEDMLIIFLFPNILTVCISLLHPGISCVGPGGVRSVEDHARVLQVHQQQGAPVKPTMTGRPPPPTDLFGC